MCRNIKTLFNFSPPATDEEIKASVRKLSGINKPNKENQLAFQTAISEITSSTRIMLDALLTNSKPKNRKAEAEKARLRNAQRFSRHNKVKAE